MDFFDTNTPFAETDYRFADIQGCTLVIELLGVDNRKKAGVSFTVMPKSFPTFIGTILLDQTPVVKVTDSEGRVEFELPQGAWFYLTSPALRGLKVPFDTAGKSVLSLAEILQTT
jgi:hypothetical protein